MYPTLAVVGGFLVRTVLGAKEPYDTLLGGLGLAAVLATAIGEKNTHAILGGIGVAVSSLVIGVEGNLLGMKRVDLFHYGFGLAVWLLANSFPALP